MKDNFSKQAELYAAYRPRYPKELFDFILSHVKNWDNAWDCATGNGQTAIELAPFFKNVYATDISQKQLDNAVSNDNIHYSLQKAEQTNFDDDTFDLVTVSQALHWFAFNDFYKEVKRVVKPGGWLAVWSYSRLPISPSIDAIIERYHFDTLGEYWDKERKYVDDNYRDIPFPFNEIAVPPFAITYEWTIRQLEGYLNTWSALQKFIAKNNYNPVDALIEEIRPHWSPEKMKVVFPIHLRMAQVDK